MTTAIPEFPTPATIRARILDGLERRMRALGIEVDRREDSPWFAAADAFSQAVADPVGQLALVAIRRAFPRTSDETGLLEWADALGVTRKAAVQAVVSVSVSGTPSATVSLAGQTLQWPDGTMYTPVDSGGTALTSIALNGSGAATILARAGTAGTVGNRATGDRLTWSSAPSGMASTGTVTTGSGDVAGTDVETLPDLALRVTARLGEAVVWGNDAAWARLFSDGDPVKGAYDRIASVRQVFVYPRTRTTTTGGVTPSTRPDPAASPVGPETPGALTVVLLGPPGAGRVPSEAVVDDAYAWLLGTGSYETAGAIVPVECDAGDFNVCAPLVSDVAVTMALTLTGQAAPFAGSFTIDSGSSGLTVRLTTNPTATVDIGDAVAVECSDARGHFVFGTVTAKTSNSITVGSLLALSVDGKIESVGAFPSAPLVGGKVYPAPPAWFATDGILERLSSLFDALGPGDHDDASDPNAVSRRYPPVDWTAPPDIHPSQIVALVQGMPALDATGTSYQGVAGVRGVTLSAPAARVVADPATVLRMGRVVVTVA